MQKLSDGAAFRAHGWTSGDGLRLYARVYETRHGAARTVVCLPGLTRNSRDFESLAQHLAPRYRLICPDLRGRGHSAWDPAWQNYQPAAYLADLAALFTSLSVTRLAVVGTSLGGLLAVLLPSMLPGVVSGTILNDIGPEIDPIGAERIRGYVGRLPPVRSWEEAVAQLKTVFGTAWPGVSEPTWHRLARRSFREDERGIPRLDVDPKVGDAMRAAPSTAPDLWPVFRSLGSLPVLAIRGALSDILSTSTFARMQREKPDLAALSVPNRGHVPLLDEPECLAAIDAFLAGLS